MNRRGFLGALLAAGVTPAIVKAANIMPVFARTGSGLLAPAYMTATEVEGNVLLTIDQITREALRLLHKKLVFVGAENQRYTEYCGGKVLTGRI